MRGDRNMSVNDAFVNNSFVGKIMTWIPEDPLTQAKFTYYLTMIVFLGLLGFGLTSWYQFFISWQIKAFFSGLFMTAVSILSLFGVKQTRVMYLATKAVYKNQKAQPKIETTEEMLNSFKNAKI